MTSSDVMTSLKAAGLDDELIEMLLTEMNTDEEDSLLKSIAHALQGNHSTFDLDFDDVWEWVGFGMKDDVERLLKNCSLLTEEVDYIEKRICNKETIIMSLNALRTLCMVASTEKGRRVYQYFRVIEDTLHEYMEMERKRREKKITDLELELENTDTDLVRLLKFADMFKSVSTMTDPETQKTMVDVMHRLLPKNAKG